MICARQVVQTSLVATEGKDVIGHVALSPVVLDGTPGGTVRYSPELDVLAI